MTREKTLDGVEEIIGKGEVVEDEEVTETAKPAEVSAEQPAEEKPTEPEKK